MSDDDPYGRSVQLTRGPIAIDDVTPGQETARFLEELKKRLGVHEVDLDRTIRDYMDTPTQLECLAVAEAVFKVELAPSSGTLSEVGLHVMAWPTVRALLDAARAAQARADDSEE